MILWARTVEIEISRNAVGAKKVASGAVELIVDGDTAQHEYLY